MDQNFKTKPDKALSIPMWVQMLCFECRGGDEDLQRSFQTKLFCCPVCAERPGAALQNPRCGWPSYKSCSSGLCWTKWIWPGNSFTDFSQYVLCACFPVLPTREKSSWEEFSLLIWVMQLLIPKLQTVIRSDLMRDLIVGAGCSVQMLLLQWTINDNGIVDIHPEHHPRQANEALFTSSWCPLSSQGRLSLLEPSRSASCGSWATCPQLIAFTQIWSCHLDTLSSTKMSKAFSSGDSAHVIAQSKETAHPRRGYKPAEHAGVGRECELRFENLEAGLPETCNLNKTAGLVGKLFEVLI